ncbi:MAG: hypothetical protein ACRDLR_03030, partial [Gaiellaceae bacterium]
MPLTETERLRKEWQVLEQLLWFAQLSEGMLDERTLALPLPPVRVRHAADGCPRVGRVVALLTAPLVFLVAALLGACAARV